MIQGLNNLLKMDVQDIINSEHSLILLKMYSVLYLNGRAPRTCANAIKEYYKILKLTGMSKATDLLKKTCVIKRKGLIYVPKLAKHISLENATDKDAIYLLQHNILTEKDFEVMPIMPMNKTTRKKKK